jgi:large-conductance mechanosensitive channel
MTWKWLSVEFPRVCAQGNVADLTVGVIIGATFGKIVSPDRGHLMPPIGFLLETYLKNIGDALVKKGRAA